MKTVSCCVLKAVFEATPSYIMEKSFVSAGETIFTLFLCLTIVGNKTQRVCGNTSTEGMEKGIWGMVLVYLNTA